MTRPLLLGHRGARFVRSIPPNTLASFDRALADGGDGFEFDVRLTKDGEAVICHDARFRGVEIAKATSDSLPSLPRLHEVLQRYQENAFLDIELKVAGLERMAADLLKKWPPARGFVISSFLPEVLGALYREDPKVPLGLICETTRQLSRWRDLPVEYVIPQYKLLSPELLTVLRREGKKVLAWTVNRASEVRKLAEWGADGIISDNPLLLAQIIGPESDR